MKIAVIRISGQVGLRKAVVETLHRLRIRRKYACVVFEDSDKNTFDMVESVRDFVSYGEINDETFKKLNEARGKEGKKFFRLHPPRGGIDAKKHFGVQKGVLGKNTEMDKLLGRML